MQSPEQKGAPLGRIHVLAYVCLCLIWGSTWLAIRVVVRDVPPLKAAAVRFLIAAAFIFGSILVRKPRWPKGPPEWNALLVLSVTVMALPYGLLFWAEQYVTSGMTAVLYSAMPLVVALLTPVMMRRTVPRQAVFAMLVAFFGLMLLFYSGPSTNPKALLGGAGVLVAVAASSWSIIYAKKRLHDVDSVVATGLQLFFGSIVLFWGTWALESHRPVVWSRQALVGIIFLAVFGSAGAFAVYYWLLKRLQPYQIATTSLVTPIIAVLEGALFLQERVPGMMIAAMAVVLGSVGWVLRAQAEPVHEGGAVLFSRNKTE
jgi:drug/metabolite transporter (DMT)-like permease